MDCKHIRKYIYVFLSFILIACSNQQTITYNIDDQTKLASSKFAIDELNSVCKELNYTPTDETPAYTIRIKIDSTGLGEQSFSIKTDGSTINVTGGASMGAMYGILELAEQIKLEGKITSYHIQQKPFIEKRGIKLNIPLDARLPSYDDTGDAAQNNIAEMWNADFWHEYLDQLARDRYNVLSLWTKHPFPSLIKLKDYPNVAMNDVYAFGKEITPETKKDWDGIDIQNKENLKLVKKITIDDKIAFWQHIMQYAHDRGIEIYFFTWNAFVTGAEKYGIQTNKENAVTYMRACVKQFALTYPHLAGIGVTAGERMSHQMAGRTKEKWLFDTYGQGIKDALAETPNRSIRFIFRRHSSYLPNIVRDFASQYPYETETSYKYSKARMYSTTAPPYFENEYKSDIKEYGFKCWMNVRNDDIFCFRWGDPDYVRDYLRNMAAYNIAGFYIGPDGYVFGREFTSKNPALSDELEVKKHWYREMLWGRLAYNPDLGTSFFKSRLANHFPNTDTQALYSLWQRASKIIPTFQGLHMKTGDALWHVEGCISDAGFQTIHDFIDCPTVDQQKIMNIPEYCKSQLNHTSDTRITPVQIADSLLVYANTSLAEAKQLKSNTNELSEELKETLADIEAMACLGAYYSHKIQASVAYYLYKAHPEKEAKTQFRQKALDELNRAEKAWNEYAENADSRYKTQLLARTRYLDWKAIAANLKMDKEIVEHSNGKLNRIALVYLHPKYTNPEIIAFREMLESKDYVPQQHPYVQIGDYANYTVRFVISSIEDEKAFRHFTEEGGVLPAHFKTTGYAIIKQNNIYWIWGKDFASTMKGIEVFTTKNNL